MTTTLLPSGKVSAVPNFAAVLAPDLSAPAGQPAFAQALQDFGLAAIFGDITPKKGPHATTAAGLQVRKMEPAEPSANCLAVVPFVPLCQKAPRIGLELSLDKGAHKPAGPISAGKAIGTAEATPEMHSAPAMPAGMMLPHADDAPPPAVQSQPADPGRLLEPFVTDASPDSLAVTATEVPEMPPSAAGELAVAVRLKTQSSQTPESGSAVAKAVPVKEPRRVDVDEAPPVQAVRESAFQTGAWTSHEGSTSAGQQAAVEKPSSPPEHLEAAAVRAERPAKAAEPLRDLSIQVGEANQEKVELRITEHAGEVRVAVRAADTDLQNGLRQNLPELVHRLEGEGYRADAWRPSGVVTSITPISEARHTSPDFQQGDQQSQPSWSQQERGQHDHNPSQRPRWVDELEGNLAGDGRIPTGAFHDHIR